MAKDALTKTAERLFGLIPAGKEAIAEALIGLPELSFSQRHFLWKVVKKYEFSLNLIGIKVPQEPMVPIVLPTEPYFVDFVSNKFVLRISDAQAEYIHTVPKAKHDRKSGLYTVPNRMYPVLQLHKFVKDQNLFTTEAAKAAVLWMYNEMRERFKASGAHDAELDMQGFGLPLDPFQRAGIKGAVRFKRGFICDGMGLGKTRQALGVIWLARAYPALVVCPASIPINWEREAAAGLLHKRIFRITGTKVPKHTCKQKQLSLLDMNRFDDSCEMCCFNQADLVIVNYDKLAMGWKQGIEVLENGKKRKIKGWKKEKGERTDIELSEVGHALKARGFRGVIIDESHYIKEETSQRTKAVLELVGGCETRLALSGTPVKNRPRELVSQLKVLDRLDDLGGNDVFRRKFCAADFVDGVFDDSGSANETELNKYLRGVGFIQRNKRDVRKDLPPIRIAEIWVDIDNRTEYERVEEDVVNWCAEQAVLKEDFLMRIAHLSPSVAAQVIEKKMIETRMRTMRAQALIKIGALKKVAALGKLSAIKSWIADFLESGNKLVVFAGLRDIQYALQRETNCLHISGNDKLSQRQHHVDVFMEAVPNDTGLSAQNIICSYKAAAEGINLDIGDDILHCELCWTPSEEDQATARIDRHRPHNITSYKILANRTIEEKIQLRLAGKREITDAITKGERGNMSASSSGSVFDEVFSDIAALATHRPSLEAVKAKYDDAYFEQAEEAADSEFLEEAI